MEEMNYHAQEDNYNDFGLDYPYAPFMILRTIEYALDSEQIQPILL